MPYHCVMRVERALNEQGRAVRGAKVALLGVSYKAGVGDVRESPALKIIALLKALGADVHYHDAFVPELREHDLADEPLEDVLDGADLVVIVTAHPGIDHAQIAGRVPALLDLRGVTRQEAAKNLARSEQAQLDLDRGEDSPVGSPGVGQSW
jgi:UDP-N-acetyl-D-glucosamine dehydrogenase